MDKEIEGNLQSTKYANEKLQDMLFINRTVLNEQHFQVDYNVSLEFVEVAKTEMYVYAQDIQNQFNGIGNILPEISDKDTFDYFRSENNTSKL